MILRFLFSILYILYSELFFFWLIYFYPIFLLLFICYLLFVKSNKDKSELNIGLILVKYWFNFSLMQVGWEFNFGVFIWFEYIENL